MQSVTYRSLVPTEDATQVSSAMQNTQHLDAAIDLAEKNDITPDRKAAHPSTELFPVGAGARICCKKRQLCMELINESIGGCGVIHRNVVPDCGGIAQRLVRADDARHDYARFRASSSFRPAALISSGSQAEV